MGYKKFWVDERETGVSWSKRGYDEKNNEEVAVETSMKHHSFCEQSLEYKLRE
jgi:hypothetical protein